MLRFRQMRILQKFVAMHGAVHNCFTQEGHLTSRENFKLRRDVASTSFTISRIIRKGCRAGTCASRSAQENKDPLVRPCPRIEVSIARSTRIENHAISRKAGEFFRRLLGRVVI